MQSKIEAFLTIEAIGKGWFHVYANGKDVDDRQKTVGLLLSRNDLQEFMIEADKEMSKPQS